MSVDTPPQPLDHDGERVRRLRHELRERWRHGERVPVEDVLAREPALHADPEGVLDLIYQEILLREERQERPRLEEYLGRFPQFAAEIEAQFEVHQVLQDGSLSTAPTQAKAPDGPARRLEVPGYEVLAELGHGGMGVVYRARHLRLGRLVALKVVRGGACADPRALDRFRAEAGALARLQHPNIVQIHEVGEHDGLPYLALEYVDGGSLARRPGGTPLPVRAAAELVRTLAGAVHHAHRMGVVHRDLKPANVLLTAAGTPKVTDFGLAKILEQEGETHSGAVLGTPGYMAPEQAAGRIRDVGPAADVYALGAILYELLTGRPPFTGATVLDTLEQVRTQEPVPPRRLQPKTPRDLETVCLKCLQKDPARRYPDAGALAEDLGHFLAGEPVRARPTGPVERLGKWARRRPAVASLLALVVFVGTAGGAAVLRQWRQTVGALAREEQAHRSADEQRREAQQNLYYHRIALAYHSWEGNDVAAAQRELDACPPELRDWEWHYVRRLCRAGLVTLADAGPLLRCVAFSPDGRYVAAGNYYGTVFLWDAATSRRQPLTGADHPREIKGIAFSPDSRLLASVSVGGGTPPEHGEVKLLDIATGQPLPAPPANDSGYWSVAFTPDGKRLLAGDGQGSITFWDVGGAGQPLVVRGHGSGRVCSLACSADGKLVASGGGDRAVHLWDVATGRRRGSLRGLGSTVHWVFFSPDAKRLVTGTYTAENGMWRTPCRLRVWDIPTGQELPVFHERDMPAGSLALSRDGRWLALGGLDSGVRLWDVTTGAEVRTYRGHSGEVVGVAFSGDGRRLASAGQDGTVRLWDLTADREEFRRWAPEPDRPRIPEPMALYPQGRLLAWRDGQTVRLLEVAAGREVLRFPEPLYVLRLAFRPDGRELAAALDGAVQVWDPATGRAVRTLPLGDGFRPTSIAFRPDGRRLVLTGSWQRPDDSGDVLILDADTGRLVGTLATDRQASGARYSADGRLVAFVNMRGQAEVWEAEAGRRLFTLGEPQPTNYNLAFSPDGRHLAASAGAGVVKVWDTLTGQETQSFARSGGLVYSLAFSPSGRRLVVVLSSPGGAAMQLKVCDPATGKEVVTLPHPAHSLYYLAFDPDGRLVASGDRGIFLWDGTPLDGDAGAAAPGP
jgi:WD40 repeat protein